LKAEIDALENDDIKSLSKTYKKGLVGDVPMKDFEREGDYQNQAAQDAIDRINAEKETFDPTATPKFLREFKEDQEKQKARKKGLRPDFAGRHLEDNRFMRKLLSSRANAIKPHT
jgi:hypothetical protein